MGTFANFVGALGGKRKSRLGPCRDRSDALSLKLVSNSQVGHVDPWRSYLFGLDWAALTCGSASGKQVPLLDALYKYAYWALYWAFLP